jgi:hypothetical protein
MYSRPNHFWVTLLAAAAVWVTLVAAGAVQAANSLPLADAWSINSSGKASSSGELLFRVSGEPGRDPVEVTVFVLSGSNETGVASSIRRALSSQLDGRRFNVEAGDGPNVLLTGDSGNRGFSVELVDSDVENVRVMVQSATPVAPPTVAPQQVPATPPTTPGTPAAPGDAAPPASEQSPAGPGPAIPSDPPATATPPAAPSAPPAVPSSPPANPSAPPAQPSAPGATTAPAPEPAPAGGAAGAPASAPPPPGTGS